MTGIGRVEWFTGDLATGAVHATLPASAGTWSLVLDDAGRYEVVLQLGDPDVAALQPYTTIEPARAFVACAYVDPTGAETLIDAGPVWTHSYDDSTRTLRIGGAGVASYYDHRKVLPVLTAGQNPATVVSTVTALSLGSIAAHLVQLAHTHTGGALPVVLPTDVAGTDARSYAGYELVAVGQAIRDLIATDGGPEVSFVPRRTAADPTKIEWVMSVGTPTQPWLVQVGDDWVWDRSAAGGSVSNLNVDRDGTGLASRAWVSGSGSAEARLIAVTDDPTLTAGGWPLLEVEAPARDTIESTTVLAGYATQAVTTARRPSEQWTLTIQPGTWPPPGAYRPGHWAQIIIGAGHPYLPSGVFRGRIVQVSGATTGPVTVQFQPSTAAYDNGST